MLISNSNICDDTEQVSIEEKTTNNYPLNFSALAPISLKKYSKVIEAQIDKNYQAYAKALVDIEEVRHFFTPEQLPSQVFTAAIAMLYIKNNTLNTMSNWKLLLKRLSANKQEGIIIAAFETSKIEQYKILPQITVDMSVFIELINRMRRIEQQYQKTSAKYILFLQHITSRALWSMLEHFTTFTKTITADKLLAELEYYKIITNRLEELDALVLNSVISEKIALLKKENSAIVKDNRLRLIQQLHQQKSILCAPRQSTVVGNYILQTFAMFKDKIEEKMDLSKVFEYCIISDSLVTINKKNYNDSSEMAFSIPIYSPSPSVRSLYGNLWHRNNSSTIDKKLYYRWWLFFSGLSLDEPKFDNQLFIKLCKTKKISKNLCTNVFWRINVGLEEELRLLNRINDDFSREEARNAAFSFVTKHYSQMDKAYQEEYKKYLDPKHPDYDALEWLMINYNAIDR